MMWDWDFGKANIKLILRFDFCFVLNLDTVTYH